MRRMRISTLIGTAALCSLALPQVASAKSCLRWDDINTLKRQDPQTLVAKTHAGAYTIKFKQPCAYLRTPSNYFQLRLHDRRECVTTIGALPVHEAGSCFIDSIEPIEDGR